MVMIVHHGSRSSMSSYAIYIKEYRQREQASKLSTHTTEHSRRLNSFYYDDDDYDYEESTIPLSEITSQIPPSIVITTSHLVLPIENPEDSHIMGNEDLNTIPKKKSDEFIKSSVEDLIPILKDIECKYSYDPNLDESTFLVTPLSDSNEDEYFNLGDDVELLLHHDLSIPKMSIASILEGFIDEPPLKENDDLFDLKPKNDDWKKILYDAPILMTEDKVFDHGIHDQNFLQHIGESLCWGRWVEVVGVVWRWWSGLEWREVAGKVLAGKPAPWSLFVAGEGGRVFVRGSGSGGVGWNGG
nr:hypothetical protein [Tanacetum cinerariifolium]